jgi:LacI family transcriptional regulator
MAVEGHAAVARIAGGRRLDIATMDDELHYIDLTPYAGRFSDLRSSLRDAGGALIAELLSQCENGAQPSGHVIPSNWHLLPSLDARVLDEPLPMNRR